MIDILIALGLFGFGISGVFLLVYMANKPIKDEKEEQISESCIGTIYIPKIKNGSKLSIGKNERTLTIMNVDQHFNWFQKKMWKFLLGIKVEDYSEEDQMNKPIENILKTEYS